ncbi:MAG: hypothetical protein WBQ17_11545 [Rhizomicrobium sp.]
MKGIVAVLALTAVLCACEEPSPFDAGQTFTYNGNQWAVSDRQDLNELQIVAVTSLATGLGTTAAYRYSVDDFPQPVFSAAVRGWFLTRGRHCTPAEGTLVAPKTWVFQYHCWHPTF